MNYYVYLLIDPNTQLPFYVGKGKGKRATTHFQESSLKHRSRKNAKIKSLLVENKNPIIEYVLENVGEHDAFDEEIRLIKHYGRLDLGSGILTNHTNGGDGASGAKHSPESIESMRQKKIGVKRSPEQILRLSAAQQGKTNSPESNQKRSAALSGMKSHTAKIIDIYDSDGNICHSTFGNFRTYCANNNLPGCALENSYRSGGKPIYTTKAGRAALAGFRCWYAKIRE